MLLVDNGEEMGQGWCQQVGRIRRPHPGQALRTSRSPAAYLFLNPGVKRKSLLSELLHADFDRGRQTRDLQVFLVPK